MTPAQTRAVGLGNPSLPQLLLTVMLRALVELVRKVASALWMRTRRWDRDWHTKPMPAALPGETNDTQSGNLPAAPDSQPPEALMVSSDAGRSPASRPSNHEGVLTGASHKLAQPGDHQLLVPLIPAKAGIQERLRALHGIAASRRNKPCVRPWIPAFAGMSGDGVMMRERVALG
jgi:hypothetical protein